MRYSAAEKAEIIRLVEQSHLPVCRTLEKLGIPRATWTPLKTHFGGKADLKIPTG
jgi:putative transposase